MSSHTHDFAIWPFPDPVATGGFCTAQVAREGFPVLRVVHDFDGDWQFLDDTTDEPGECVLLCLGCVFEKHPDVAAVADLPRGWAACRDSVGAEWDRWEMDPDDAEEDAPHACQDPEADARALANIEQYGLHILSVTGDDDHVPFTYSIGIEQTLGMPELIMIGLQPNVAASAINECYRQMKEGGAIAPGWRVANLLGGGFECQIGEVSPEQAAQYMIWAKWLYKDKPFRAWQIIWPSTAGFFPWDAGASEWLITHQALLA